MPDLKAQLGDYLDHVVNRVSVEDIYEDRVAREFSTSTPAPAHTDGFEPDEGDLIMVDIQTREPELPGIDRRRWAGLAILAAAAVIIVIVAIAMFDDTEESTPVDVVSPDGDESIETPPTPVEAPLDFVAGYFAAHDTGELETVLAWFRPEATFSDTDTATLARPDWEPRVAWDMAQERVYTSPDCTVIEEVPGSTVTVSCVYDSHDAVARAAGAVTPLTATLTVTPEGISDLREDYRRPSYADIGEPFGDWLAREHPDDADVAGCCEGETVAESVARGELRAAYAAEWGDYLEANGCTYPNHDC